MTEFEQIYREHFSGVYSFVKRLSGDKELAEEITSETFFKALKSIGSFRGECSLRVWLCQIAKNCYYSHLKRQGRETSVEPELLDIPCEDETPEECSLRAGEAEQARSALHKLPEPYREVFMWRVFGELSFRQIGRIFHKSENWACVTYHRARGMLKKGMEEET